MLDIVSTLYGEILPLSMMGVKGLNDSVQSIVDIFVPINIQMHAL